MLDTLNWVRTRAEVSFPRTLVKLGLQKQAYLLCTVHRSENTDNIERLSGILGAMGALGEPVVLPAHPRTRKAIQLANISLPRNLLLIDPLSYSEMVSLSASARVILTDSGGLQKEAYWLGVPCITLRDETEWTETVEAGWNVLAGSNSESIVQAVRSFVRPACRPPLYGDVGVASICASLID